MINAVTAAPPLNVGSFPGFDTIKKNIESGNAKLINVYPVSVVKNGQWAVEYQRNPGKYLDYTYTGDWIDSPPTRVLEMNGTIYPPSNDWVIEPIMRSYAVGATADDPGITQTEPTGKYRLRSRADGDVFNEMVIGEGTGGTINAYNPNIFQTGSNAGGFFGSSLAGNFLNDLVTMTQDLAPVLGPALSFNLAAGNLGSLFDGGTAAASAAEAGTTADILNSATSGLQDVYGGVLPIDQVAAGIEAISPEVVTTGTGIPTPDVTPTAIPAVETPVTQPDYFTADAAATDAVVQDPFAYTTEDVTNPLADTTASAPTELPTDIPNVTNTTTTTTPTEVPNLEGGDLGMTEAQAQEQFYKDIGIDPTTLKDLPPASTAEINQILQGGTNAISLSDINKIRSIVSTANAAKNVLSSTGLLGGAAGALAGAAAVGALTGGGSSTTPAPVSQAGTYSGTANYSPEYYQQIQQNYNRLFPTAPADITTPLQSWYATKFVPDTNISKKLFGV